ncbi:MAG: heparin lyase I family protein [Sphingobium sp.]
MMRQIAILSGIAQLVACGGHSAAGSPSSGTGEAPAMEYQNIGAQWSVSSNGETLRFEVRRGDHLPGDGEETKERSEAYSKARLEFGQAYDISYRLEIAPGPRNTAAWMALTQIQSTFDPGEAGHSPPFGIYLKGERMQVLARHSPEPVTPPDGFVTIPLHDDRSDVKRGHDYRMRIRVRFDQGGTGSLRLWRDGVALARHDGPFGFNDRKGPYLKIGVYRASAPESFAVTIRDLRVRPVASVDE